VGSFLEQTSRRKPPRIQDATTRFTLDKGFLALGLDGAASGVTRLGALRKNGFTGLFASGTAAFSPNDIAESKSLVAEWRLTSKEERALAGSYPALLSYFRVVQQTEKLADLMIRIVDRPSLLSLAANLGISGVEFDGKEGAFLSLEPAATWRLPDSCEI
jgi:hypothetical protein